MWFGKAASEGAKRLENFAHVVDHTKFPSTYNSPLGVGLQLVGGGVGAVRRRCSASFMQRILPRFRKGRNTNTRHPEVVTITNIAQLHNPNRMA